VYPQSIVPMIRLVAHAYGVCPGLAVIICRRESSFNPTAVGDQGQAVGLWQWHIASWNQVRDSMGLRGLDLRKDPYESTITAMFAMGVLHLYRWWSTYKPALNEMAGLPDE